MCVGVLFGSGSIATCVPLSTWTVQMTEIPLTTTQNATKARVEALIVPLCLLWASWLCRKGDVHRTHSHVYPHRGLIGPAAARSLNKTKCFLTRSVNARVGFLLNGVGACRSGRLMSKAMTGDQPRQAGCFVGYGKTGRIHETNERTGSPPRRHVTQN